MAGTYSTDDLLTAILIELRVMNRLREIGEGEESDDTQSVRYDFELALGNGATPYGNSTLSAANTHE